MLAGLFVFLLSLWVWSVADLKIKSAVIEKGRAKSDSEQTTG